MFEVLELAAVNPLADEADLIARIAELERIKSAAAAGQARVTAALDAARRAREYDEGVPAAKRGRGLASEVALARSDSPFHGNQHLGFAKALVHEMPHTLAALQSGGLSEWRATLIVRESACLSVNDRRRLDNELCADPTRLQGWGNKRIEAEAKKIAYRLDPHAVVDRAARAPAERRVSIRPAPDAMTYVTALLPVAQGVSVYAALKRSADTTFDDRTGNQIMADTMVERVTGRPADVPVPVEVNVVMTAGALLGHDETPAVVQGHGPVPAAVGRRLVIEAAGDARSKAALRRLYAKPVTGALVAMESRARRFPKALAAFIAARDQTCRTPYCDAPIRHTDHAHPYRRGGPTNAVNGLGLCERCNYIKEVRGWQVITASDEKAGHTAVFTTPTGTRYRSTAPPGPGATPVTVSRIETRIRNHLGGLRAS